MTFLITSTSSQDQRAVCENLRRSHNRHGDRCISHQPSVYLKSGLSEAPGFIMTEAQSFHTAVAFALQRRERHSMSYQMAQRLITHPENAYSSQKSRAIPVTQGRELRQHKYSKGDEPSCFSGQTATIILKCISNALTNKCFF